ncbi:MAG: GGDEF domain-containing protein, partial [Actinomycetota bacterium]
AIALARYVGAPMRPLPWAAARIGAGGDVDVGRHGPAEVRRVGRALEIAAEGLALVERLEHEATHDDLTGVPRRRLVREHLQQALSRSRRSGQSGAVMFVDIDHFKDINDTYGHAAGDVVLVAIADRLRDTLRFGDVLGRFGGDEFVVIAEPVGGPDEAFAFARRLVEVVAAPISVADVTDMAPGGTVVATVSVGVALFGRRTEAGLDVLRRADSATYEAKAGGRNCAVLIDDDGRVHSSAGTAEWVG